MTQVQRAADASQTRCDAEPHDATEAIAAPSRVAGAADGTELGPGDLLGAWRLREPLGHGGMGAVYLAERADGHFEQVAAIKLIRGAPDERTFVQFARERQILATLQHPNIARLLDGGATPRGQPYFVMEYVEGRPIDAYCAEHALDLGARLRLFRQVCLAVQFAHQRLIVHCDLKPSNVLVREDGAPVLLDFGIAHMLDRPRAQAHAGGYLTPDYASPEQLRGAPVTTTSDVYALGLILFELIAGRRAREGGDGATAPLRTSPPRPSRRADGVPWRRRLRGDLDAIVLRASADEPHARYASAEDLARDVQCFLEHRPVLARAQAPPSYALAKLVRRRWPAFAAAALLALTAAAFTWRLIAARDRARAAEHGARVQAAAAERVSEFLVSVFNVSNPQYNHDREISARAVLDEGAARIEKELDGQPRIKARLLGTLATAYRYIGAPARSAELFRAAIELYLDPRVDDPLAAAAASSQLAIVYANDVPGADAVGAARRSLTLRERYAPDDPLALGDAYNTLGVALEAEDQYDAAERALRRGLELRRAGRADDSTIASSLHNLGLVVGARGDRKGSLPYFVEAMRLRARSPGERSTAFQATLQVYGVNLVASGDYANGVPALERNLALCRELYGDDSVHTADAHNELGSAVHDLGRYGQAIAHYKEDLRIETATVGEAGTFLPLNNLASAYEDMGDYARALPLFERSLELREKTLAADDAHVLRAKQNLARVLLDMGRTQRAKPLIDEALAGFRERLGTDNVNTVKAEFALASWQAATGRSAELADSVKTLRASKVPFTPLMTARLHALEADLAASRHDAAAALAADEAAWRTLRDAFGEQHPQVAEFAVRYANVLADFGRARAARAFVAPYVAIVDAAFAPEAPVRRIVARWR